MELPPSSHDPGAVRDLADSILAQPRYDRPPRSLPDRVLDWFGEQLGRVLGSLVSGEAGALLAWAFVIAALALVAYLVLRFGRVGRLPTPARHRDEVMIELTRSPAEWRAEAERLEAAGRWKEGLRCRHRALVAELVRRGTLPDRPGRTAREHVREVASSLPGAVEPLAAATDLFEAAWYGDAPTGQDEARRFEALASQVLDGRVRV